MTYFITDALLQADDKSKLDSLGLLGLAAVVDVISSKQGLWGMDCSPFLGGNSACSNKPICCENNQMVSVPVSSFSSFTNVSRH
jgi:hypothetical protein